MVGAGVLVVGGGMIGCEAAEFLGERGHRVAVVEMREDIAADVRPEHRRCLLKNLRESQVLVRTGARVERFYPDGWIMSWPTGQRAPFGDMTAWCWPWGPAAGRS